MKFHSTKKSQDDNTPSVELKESVLNGLAPDGGLYMLNAIPKFDDKFFYVCGVKEMVIQVKERLINLGVKEERIKIEKFV